MRPPCASTRPLRDRQAEAEARPVAAFRRPRGRTARTGAAAPRPGCPARGPRPSTCTSPFARRAATSNLRARAARTWSHSRSGWTGPGRSPRSPATRRQVVRYLRSPRCGARSCGRSRPRTSSTSAPTSYQPLSGRRLPPSMRERSSRLPTMRFSRWAWSTIACAKSCRSSSSPDDVVLLQAAGGGHDRRQRRAQVVRDGVEQRAAAARRCGAGSRPRLASRRRRARSTASPSARRRPTGADRRPGRTGPTRARRLTGAPRPVDHRLAPGPGVRGRAARRRTAAARRSRDQTHPATRHGRLCVEWPRPVLSTCAAESVPA